MEEMSELRKQDTLLFNQIMEKKLVLKSIAYTNTNKMLRSEKLELADMRQKEARNLKLLIAKREGVLWSIYHAEREAGVKQ